ncbi:hypothetical protein GJ698_02840 [Pseudoduganella sp. FT26W]|uniref:Uncharacterized protein n=1 Tax=Duganella aquatilis TaxID=2666082 RepID=A0A844D4G8_9BURK|nr:hypothetical protein [Duganella aquatilis]MRW83026.1 hypothetical protein [Duganella aquatilis]
MSAAAHKTVAAEAPLHPARSDAIHEPFSFLVPGLKHDQGAHFAADVMDIAQGIGLCLELVNSSTLDRTLSADTGPQHTVRPILGECDTERLLRFATTSARMLAIAAETRIALLNDRASMPSPATMPEVRA